MNYRKLYQEQIGPIPIDADGRTYEIHHIDGNRSNNSIDNLIAVSIEEHYNIHFENGDHGACWGILSRMKEDPEQKSLLISLHQKKLVKEGRHPFQNKQIQSQNGKKAAASGKTPKFTKDNEYQKKAQKTHKKLVEEGRHPFQINNGSQLEWKCEQCGKKGKGASNYKRYHGIECKYVK